MKVNKVNDSNGKLLVLVDGSSYLYRAYHALPALATAQGEPTGAIYGVVNMLRKLIGDYQPDLMAVVLDTPGKNFRHEIYPKYKANRPLMDQELVVQLEPLKQIIQAMGITVVSFSGIEADDVIGTLTKQALAKNLKILISTGDKDLAQLVNSQVTLVNTMSGAVLDESGVKNKFGVTPAQMVDYLTLVGDSSDNIIGVKGVGPKTAAKWLEQYGDLENILRHFDELVGKVKFNLKDSADTLELTKQVVTIRTDFKLETFLDSLTLKASDNQCLKEFFTRLEFKSWLMELEKYEPSNNPVKDYNLILSEKDLDAWIYKIKTVGAFAFDLETTSLEVLQAKIVGIALACKPEEAAYIPCAHNYPGALSQLPLALVLKKLSVIFEDPKLIKLGQNLKYDLEVLANYGLEVSATIYDTMLESYVVNSSLTHHDKVSLAARYLGRSIASYEQVVGKGAKQLLFSQVELERALSYAALDADLVLQLHEVLWSKLCADGALKSLLMRIELPLVRVLAKMERQGVMVDIAALKEQSIKVAAELNFLEGEIYEDAGIKFNINSPAQLQEILYGKFKLPVLKKTATGQPSTAEAVLQELARDYPLPQLIIKYRELAKLKSTYLDALPKQLNPITGKIHTSYNQAITATGRLSSSNPNLQNIPIRTELGKEIRRAFVAPKGCKILSADYSQIELRIMAHLADDQSLIEAFKAGEDIHQLVAAEVFQVAPNEVTTAQRRDAKTINFGIIYGISPFGLAKRIGISKKQAEAYIELYFSRYPKVFEYMQKMKQQALQNGYTTSMLGRRFYFPEIKAKNFVRRQAAERAAINAPIQGSAADLIKIAMIEIADWISKQSFEISMIMQVHDELVFEVSELYLELATAKIKTFMETAITLKVPLVVETGIGNNWGEAH